MSFEFFFSGDGCMNNANEVWGKPYGGVDSWEGIIRRFGYPFELPIKICILRSVDLREYIE